MTLRSGLVGLAALLAAGPAAADELEDEENLAVAAAPLLGPLHRIPPGEGEGLATALRAEYARMRAARPPFSSSVLGPVGPERFDVRLHEASGARVPVAVVFLHGYGGAFALPCWQVASAAARVGIETACPSVGREGDWWTARGERTVRETIRWVRERGAARVVLAGLSNGGIGASRLAPRLRGQIDGLVLLSGAAPLPAPRRLPVLVVHGRQDRMTSAAVASRYARSAGRRGTLVLLPGDHFLLVRRAAEIQDRIATWLRESFTTR